MMKTITNVIGAVMVLTGLIGFVNPNFMSFALSPLHNVILLVVGAVALYFGIRGTEYQARNTCRTLGILFSALGLLTFLLGGPGTATAGNVAIQANDVWKIIPGQLEYTTADGIRNLVVGVLGLFAGFFPREKEIQIDMAAKEKVASR